MQGYAIEQFLKSLKDERDFDLPFVAMLRTLGFFDVHCVHGVYEFGKDFVAKRQEGGELFQYTLQTKFGDLGKTEFSEVRRQCEEMATTDIGHPSLDSKLPRKLVVAFTGRFKGEATLAAQEYQKSLPRRNLPPVDYWSQERLLQYLTSEACLIRMDWKAAGRILKECDVGSLGPLEIERALRDFELYENDGWKTILFFSVLASHCRIDSLRIHAFHLLLVCLRLIEAAKLESKIQQDIANEMESLILAHLAFYGREIINGYQSIPVELRQSELLSLENPMDIVVASPRLLLMSEIVAFYVLIETLDAAENSSAKTYFGDLLALESSVHPISEKYAISILVVGCAAHKLGIDIRPWIMRVLDWITTKQNDLGLSNLTVSTVEEVFTVLVTKNEDSFLKLTSKNNSSRLATALLDLACVTEFEVEFEKQMIRYNELQLIPISITPETYPFSLFPGKGGIISVESNDYPSKWKPELGLYQATHHSYSSAVSNLDEACVRLALWLLLRDRWSMDFAALLGKIGNVAQEIRK